MPSFQVGSTERTTRPGANYNRIRFLIAKSIARPPTHSTKLGGMTGTFLVNSPRDIGVVDYMAGERNLLLATCGQVLEGDTVWDVGANVGHWTVFLGLSVGKSGTVVAFEPFDKAAELLQKNIDLNNLHSILIAKVALSDREGTGVMSVGQYGSDPLSSLVRHRGGSENQVDVQQASVDELVEQNRYPFPNVVKIDVEGAEFLVVKGMGKALGDPRLRMVVCETNPSLLQNQGASVDEVVNAFDQRGFQCTLVPRVRGDDVHVIALRKSQ